MIINMEVEDISNEYAHQHISLKTDCSDSPYIEHLKITRVLYTNIEIVLNIEDFVKKRFILRLRVYDGQSVEMNDMINLYKCIYYKEKYEKIIRELNEKKNVSELAEKENQIRNDLIDNYNIMLTSISEIFSRYYLRYQTTKFNIDSDSDNIIESEYTNY